MAHRAAWLAGMVWGTIGCGGAAQCPDGYHPNADGNCLLDEADADTDTDADTDADTDTDPDRDADGDGYTAADGDCDDAAATVHPGAEEVCGNGVDEDCAGSVGCSFEGQIDLLDAHAKLVGEPSDRAGTALAVADFEGDGAPDIAVGAMWTATLAGAVYVVSGAPSGATGLQRALRLDGVASSDMAGTALWAGDLDGDGAAELLVGAYGEDEGGGAAGAVYLVRGPLVGGSLGGAVKIVGETTGDGAGWALAAADIDGDGAADPVVCAPGVDDGGSNAGAVYVLDGPPATELDLSRAPGWLIGESAEDAAGRAVWTGDLDGDGLGDLLVGAAGQDGGALNGGAVYFVSGPPSGSEDLGTAEGKIVGEDASDAVGNAVWGGDLDGDGVGDVLLGASEAGDSGSVYVLYGPLGGEVDLYAADAEIEGERAGDGAGGRVTASDLDGDGRAELVLGATGEDAGGSGAGAVYIVTGPALGRSTLFDATAFFTGEDESDAAGAAVWAGDLDGAAGGDLVLGATLEDAGGAEAGAAYVFYGEGD